MRSDNMALYRDLTLYNFVYILLDYPTLFYDLLGEIRYDYSSSVGCTTIQLQGLWSTTAIDGIIYLMLVGTPLVTDSRPYR